MGGVTGGVDLLKVGVDLVSVGVDLLKVVVNLVPDDVVLFV
jgi:hypothetical protein